MSSRLKARVTANRQDGFTLIELLIVIVILGILAGIVIFAVGSARNDSAQSACKAEIATLNTASEAYKAKYGAYPASAALLASTDFIKDSTLGGDGYSVTFVAAGSTGTFKKDGVDTACN